METTAARSNRLDADSSSDIVLNAWRPKEPPPRVIDYDELDKKAVDVLVDSLKYIATTCGIAIAMYSQAVREYVKEIAGDPLAQSFLFFPLVLWFTAIVSTVLGIYPRRYSATTDAQKEAAILKLRNTKRRWLSAALVPFLAGFGMFLYVIGAQIWRFYPFP